MDVVVKVLGALALAVLVIVAIGVLIACPIMWLWNGLFPELFGCKTIGFWQALGLYGFVRCFATQVK